MSIVSKAVVMREIGAPDVLEVREIEMPLLMPKDRISAMARPGP